MKLPRRSRFIVAMIMLFSMFIMQVSIAACSCSEASMLPVPTHHAPAENTMVHPTGCGHAKHMNNDGCPSHIQVSKKAVDTVEIPKIVPFIPGILIAVFLDSSLKQSSTAIPTDTPDTLIGSAPPLCARHCSYQI